MLFFLTPFAPKISCETGSAVPSRISLLILLNQAESGAYSQDFSRNRRRRPHSSDTLCIAHVNNRDRKYINFSCSDDHEQDWQPYPLDPYSSMCDDHTHFIPIMGVGKERRTLIDPWRYLKRPHQSAPPLFPHLLLACSGHG